MSWGGKLRETCRSQHVFWTGVREQVEYTTPKQPNISRHQHPQIYGLFFFEAQNRGPSGTKKCSQIIRGLYSGGPSENPLPKPGKSRIPGSRIQGPGPLMLSNNPTPSPCQNRMRGGSMNVCMACITLYVEYMYLLSGNNLLASVGVCLCV